MTPTAEDRAAAKELRHQVRSLLDRIKSIDGQMDQLPRLFSDPKEVQRYTDLDRDRIHMLRQIVSQLVNRASRLERGTGATHAGGGR